MYRHVRLILVAALVACGSKTTNGGLEVVVDYVLESPGDGCVRLEASPDMGTPVADEVSLTGRPRAGKVTFAVMQGEGWPATVKLHGSLHAAACGGAEVASVTGTALFPHGRVERVELSLREGSRDGGMAGGAGGGSGGAGGAGGGQTAGAGGGTAGAAAGGTAGGAGGGTAGGAAGGTAGGAAGGAAGGTAGGMAGGGAAEFCNEVGLMGCWPMYEGSGTVVNDLSPNNNDGTIVSATWVQSDAGVALSFSGNGDEYVTVPDDPTLTSPNAITLEAWIKPSALGTDNALDRVIDKGLQTEYAVGIGYGGGELTASVGPDFRRSNTNLSAGVWQHVGVTWADGDGPTFWINGIAVNTGVVINGAIPNGPEDLRFGFSTTNNGASQRYRGLMRRVRIYSRVKTAQEMCVAAGRTWAAVVCL